MSSSQDVINRSKLPYLPPVTPGMQYRRAQQCEKRDVNKWLRAVGSRFTSEETGQATNEELERQIAPAMSTPKKPTSTVHKPNNLEPTSTPPSLRARRRAHNLRHSDSPPQTQRSNSGTLRVVNASSDTDSSEEYGQAITPQLDEMAVQKLPPRLQRALRSLQEEREARAATPTEGDSLATLRTTALGSHPPTDDECAFARRLKRPHDHGLETTTCAGTGELPVQATRHRLRPALKRARSFIGLNTLRAKKVAGETVTQGLGAAKKWAKGLTRKGRGEGVVEEVIEGDEEIEGKEIEGGKEEEGGVMRRKVDLGGTKAQRMTVRGALESYI